MSNLKLVQKLVIFPEKTTTRRRIFLSNIDHSLVAYQESVSFIDPPQISFQECINKLYRALERLFVPYDFFAGRLVPSLEDSQRLEIDCNDAGVVVAIAKTDTELSQFGDLVEPKPEYKQFVAFLHEENEEQMEKEEFPLLFIQLTQLGCGGLAFASRYNHCVLDGVAVREFQANMAALTRGKELVIVPNPNRTIFKARNPPVITHPHHEYSKSASTDGLYTSRGEVKTLPVQAPIQGQTRMIHLSPHHISKLKKAVQGKLYNCTTFEAVAAKIWKARTIAVEKDDDKVSTMLFPVDVRRRVVPEAPVGFAGNALIPGFARATVRELKEEEDYVLVKKVREGVERLDNEYIRSSIDWLEVNKGVPCAENSFSVVSWWRLGLEEDEFVWGKLKCSTPVAIKPGLVYLLPGPQEKGGLSICLELPDDQVNEFCRVMMEVTPGKL